MLQSQASPNVRLYAGVVLDSPGPALNTKSLLSWGINGASSFIQVNNNTAITGNVGAFNMTKITLGAYGSGLTSFGNFQVNELITRSVASSAATRLAIQQRLAALHGITL